MVLYYSHNYPSLDISIVGDVSSFAIGHKNFCAVNCFFVAANNQNATTPQSVIGITV
jgi:Ca2+-dependent lipid-binding protein